MEHTMSIPAILRRRTLPVPAASTNPGINSPSA